MTPSTSGTDVAHRPSALPGAASRRGRVGAAPGSGGRLRRARLRQSIETEIAVRRVERGR